MNDINDTSKLTVMAFTFMLNLMPWALQIVTNTLWYNIERLEWNKRLAATA